MPSFTVSFQLKLRTLQRLAVFSLTLLAPMALIAQQVPPRNGQLITPTSGVGTMGTSTMFSTHPDGAGGVWVVWSPRSGGLYAQRTTRSGGGQWSQPVRVSSSSSGSAVDGAAGDFYATLGSGQITRVLADGSIARGWPVTINGMGSITEDGLGGVVYLVGAMPHRVNRLNPDASRAWAADVELPFKSAFGEYPPYYRLVTDGSGGAFLVWHAEDSNGSSGVYAGHVTSQGEIDSRWPMNGKSIAAAGENPNKAWAPDGTGGLLVGVKEALPQSRIRFYVHRVDADGSFHRGWPAEVFEGSSSYNFEEIQADGSGGVIATRTGQLSTDPHPRCRLIGADGSWKWDKEFSPDTRELSWVIVGGTARVAGRTGLDISIFVLDMSNGSEACKDTLCSADGIQWLPKATPDTKGGVVVTWLDQRSSSTNHVFLGWFNRECTTPVQLGDIRGEARADFVEIRWGGHATGRTAFVVERSPSAAESYERLGGTLEVDAGPFSVSFRDSTAIPGNRYFYRVSEQDEQGNQRLYGPVVVEAWRLGSHDLSLEVIGGHEGLPINLRYEVPNGLLNEPALLVVYDVLGRRTKMLMQGRIGANKGAVPWDGSDARGARVASGIYFARLAIARQSRSCRVLVLDH